MGAGVSTTPPPSEPQEIDPEELKRRTEFLKSQRDKVSQVIIKQLVIAIACRDEN